MTKTAWFQVPRFSLTFNIKMRVFVCLLLSLSLASCAHTRHVNLPPNKQDLEELNALLKNKTSEIELKNGERYIAKNMQFNPGHITFTNKEDSLITCDFSQIRKLIWRNHGRGAKEGLKYGFLWGFGLGTMTGFLSHLVITRKIETNVLIAISTTFNWALIGSAVGGVNGAKEILLIAPE